MKGNEKIENLYYEEEMCEISEAKDVKYSVESSIESVGMLFAIAERFNQTRFSLLAPIIEGAVEDMFHALSERDKASLSKVADEQSTKLGAKNGLTLNRFHHDNVPDEGCIFWQLRNEDYKIASKDPKEAKEALREVS